MLCENPLVAVTIIISTKGYLNICRDLSAHEVRGVHMCFSVVVFTGARVVIETEVLFNVRVGFVRQSIGRNLFK